MMMQNSPSGGGLGVFGKSLTKGKIRNFLSNLGGMAGEEDEEDLTSFLSGAKLGRGGAPQYSPNKFYGNLFRAYGGRPVRGGLLGE
jgi:hypothetical protein